MPKLNDIFLPFLYTFLNVCLVYTLFLVVVLYNVPSWLSVASGRLQIWNSSCSSFLFTQIHQQTKHFPYSVNLASFLFYNNNVCFIAFSLLHHHHTLPAIWTEAEIYSVFTDLTFTERDDYADSDTYILGILSLFAADDVLTHFQHFDFWKFTANLWTVIILGFPVFLLCIRLKGIWRFISGVSSTNWSHFATFAFITLCCIIFCIE